MERTVLSIYFKIIIIYIYFLSSHKTLDHATFKITLCKQDPRPTHSNVWEHLNVGSCVTAVPANVNMVAGLEATVDILDCRLLQDTWMTPHKAGFSSRLSTW